MPGLAATLVPFSTAPTGQPPQAWRLITLPKLPRHTHYAVVERDATHVLRMEADGSYGNLMARLAPPAHRTTLRWRWRVETLSMRTDIRRRSGDDVPARLCVLFDLPLERLAASDRLAVRLGRALFDPDLPAATLCYIWDAHIDPGTWLPNAYSGRVMQLVLQSGPATAWKEERRDLRQDFAAAFPTESANGPLPPVAAIGLSADGDNTGAQSVAFVGDIVLEGE